MKNVNWDKVWVGFVIGVLMPIIVYTIYYYFVYNSGLKKMNVSLCIATNLIPFYFYQRKEKYNGLKGVLIATFVWAGLIFGLAFFTNYLRIN